MADITDARPFELDGEIIPNLYVTDDHFLKITNLQEINILQFIAQNTKDTPVCPDFTIESSTQFPNRVGAETQYVRMKKCKYVLADYEFSEDDNKAKNDASNFAFACFTLLETLKRIGIVHGDISPYNIVFDEVDKPRLIDFEGASFANSSLNSPYKCASLIDFASVSITISHFAENNFCVHRHEDDAEAMIFTIASIFERFPWEVSSSTKLTNQKLCDIARKKLMWHKATSELYFNTANLELCKLYAQEYIASIFEAHHN